MFINIPAGISRGIWLQLSIEQCVSLLPSRTSAAQGDLWETRGCCSASRMCCRASVSSQQRSFRGPVIQQESEITRLWCPNIVAREEHLVSRPGTTYSEHYSSRSPMPSSILRLCSEETRFSELSIPPCPSAPIHSSISCSPWAHPASVSPNSC